MPTCKLQRSNAILTKRLLRKYSHNAITSEKVQKVQSVGTHLPIAPILQQELICLLHCLQNWHNVINESCLVHGVQTTSIPQQDILLKFMLEWIQESDELIHPFAVAFTTEDTTYNEIMELESSQTRILVERVFPCTLDIVADGMQYEPDIWRMYVWQSVEWSHGHGYKHSITNFLTAMLHGAWLLAFAKRTGQALEMCAMRGALLAFKEE